MGSPLVPKDVGKSLSTWGYLCPESIEVGLNVVIRLETNSLAYLVGFHIGGYCVVHVVGCGSVFL